MFVYRSSYDLGFETTIFVGDLNCQKLRQKTFITLTTCCSFFVASRNLALDLNIDHLLLQVNGVMFSPDAKRVVSCGSDFYMKVIDLKTGSILFSKGPFSFSGPL